VNHPWLGELPMPGAPFFLSETPWKLSEAPPLLGEHNPQVFGEIGLGPRELEELRTGGVI
jgi:crotonobetainyl-CoA:carnitine CoA-transferase CaiB-like acyl-CoA transferase